MSETFDQEVSPSQRLRSMEAFVAGMTDEEVAWYRADYAQRATWDALWLEAIDRRITTEGSVA